MIMSRSYVFKDLQSQVRASPTLCCRCVCSYLTLTQFFFYCITGVDKLVKAPFSVFFISQYQQSAVFIALGTSDVKADVFTCQD